VEVDHERNERPDHARARSTEHGEPRAGYLGGALEIKNAEVNAELPVGLGLEVELPRCAPPADLDVL